MNTTVTGLPALAGTVDATVDAPATDACDGKQAPAKALGDRNGTRSPLAGVADLGGQHCIVGSRTRIGRRVVAVGHEDPATTISSATSGWHIAIDCLAGGVADAACNGYKLVSGNFTVSRMLRRTRVAVLWFFRFFQFGTGFARSCTAR
jgi:hypothetical protein